MLAIGGFAGYGVTQVALRLAPHLFVRPSELRHAQWAEFDFNERVWAIPADKTKMRRPLHVPLSTQALEIIAHIRPISGRHRALHESCVPGMQGARQIATYLSAGDDVYRQPSEAGFFVLFAHVGTGLAHRLNDLVERDPVSTVAEQR